jgi:hypothetical protein
MLARNIRNLRYSYNIDIRLLVSFPYEKMSTFLGKEVQDTTYYKHGQQIFQNVEHFSTLEHL